MTYSIYRLPDTNVVVELNDFVTPDGKHTPRPVAYTKEQLTSMRESHVASSTASLARLDAMLALLVE